MSDFNSLVANVLPLSLGAAISPTVLVGIILVLSSSKRPRLNGTAFYLGSIILLLLVVALGIAASQMTVSIIGMHSQKASGGFDFVLGAVLIFLGFRRITKKKEAQEDKNKLKEEKNQSAIASFFRYMIFGFVMFTVNFTTTVLVFAAGKDIGLSLTGLAGKLMATAILTVITLLVVEIPLAIYFLFPKTAGKILDPLNVWMKKNENYLIAVLIFVFGFYLLVKGFYS